MRPELADIVPVILAGGQGSRLRPLSTPAKPKPFLKLASGKSFLQRTAERVAGLKPPVVVCSERHRELVMAQVKVGQIILEPEARGTAPAIAAAAHLLAVKADPLMLVLPSDHAVKSPDMLLDAIATGTAAAKEGMLVTFGITPRHPSPHYGYIKAGESLGNGALRIASFAEKPGREKAQDYIRQGNCFWNSGMFLFSAKAFLGSLKTQRQDIHDGAYNALKSASRLQNSVFLNREAFSACPALSIDYAVMENASSGAVIPVAMGWRDLGTWPSLLASLLRI